MLKRISRLLAVLSSAQLALASSRLPSSISVATLSNHDGGAWRSSGNCTASDKATVECNMRLYTEAARVAKASGADLILYPEGYGLTNGLSLSSFFEPIASGVGTIPCDTADSAAMPQQAGLSCVAKYQSIGVVANIFLELGNGTRLIMDIAFDRNGTVLAHYAKHHLFATEVPFVHPGPYKPTVVDFEGHRFGLVICYEGVYPDLTNDWSQLEALKAQGAEVLLWSVGRDVPLELFGAHLARRTGLPVVASEEVAEGIIVGADGKSMPGQQRVAVRVEDFDGDDTAVRVVHMLVT